MVSPHRDFAQEEADEKRDARLSAPSGANVLERARLISLPKGEYTACVENIARALQQYGDERAATRDAEIARLREAFDRTCKQHAEAMRGTCNTYQAEIARLAEQNHFFQVNYQDEIGISGLKEERDALLAQRDAEIEELQQERDQAIHSLDLRHTRYVALEAEIAKLRDVERRHLGWCDACLVYHRIGNCPVTDEPPSKEAREGWSLPTPRAAPPGADVLELFDRVFSPGNIIGMPAGDFRDMAVHALQQYGDERAAAAAAAKPQLSAVVGALFEAAKRAAREAAIEEVVAAIKNLPSCPFDKPTRLKPEEPCPVCGDTGEFNDKPSNCSSPMIAIHALAAKPGSET